jgi:hypothetical protein
MLGWPDRRPQSSIIAVSWIETAGIDRASAGRRVECDALWINARWATVTGAARQGNR